LFITINRILLYDSNQVYGGGVYNVWKKY